MTAKELKERYFKGEQRGDINPSDFVVIAVPFQKCRVLDDEDKLPQKHTFVIYPRGFVGGDVHASFASLHMW